MKIGKREISWTVEQVAMFARENVGRRIRGTRTVADEVVEGLLTDVGMDSIPVLYVNEFRIDPSTVEFLDGKPEAAPQVPGDLTSSDAGITWCGVADNGYQCTRPKGHPPTAHVARTYNGTDVCRWPVAATDAVRFSLFENARDPRFATIVKPPPPPEQSENTSAPSPKNARLSPRPEGAPSVARKVDSEAVAEEVNRLFNVAVSDFVVADAVFLGHVDELLRWAQGHTDRDLVRDRVCRALGPLLRERMGRKLG